jgi:hypothetical protein
MEVKVRKHFMSIYYRKSSIELMQKVFICDIDIKTSMKTNDPQYIYQIENSVLMLNIYFSNDIDIVSYR